MADRADRARLTRAAAAAARVHPTPFYFFARTVAERGLRAWRMAAGSEVDLFYPWKCNRYAALRTLAGREGWGAEVTAPDDLAAALSSMSGAGRVVFQGPAKDAASIDAALAAGAWLVADGTADGLAILDRARTADLAARYLLRFRPAAAKPQQRPFGMLPAEAIAFGRRMVREGRPVPRGLAFHLGTGLPSTAPYVSAIREAGRIAAALASDGIPTHVIDAGGGFPARGEARRDADGRRGRPPRAIVRELRMAVRTALPGARLFLEPGRAVASDAFHLVTRVVRVTSGRIYLDASRMSHAFFVANGRHPFWPVPRRPGGGSTLIAGPLPLDLDVFSRAERVGRPREGDLLVIGSVGAYNLIASSAWAGRMLDVVEPTAGSYFRLSMISSSAWRPGRRRSSAIATMGSSPRPERERKSRLAGST